MRRFIFLVIPLLLLPCLACAAAWQVSPDGMSLTEALAACTDGDVITLAAGVYEEPKEVFPLTITKSVTLTAGEGAVIDAPPFLPALRVEADGVCLKGLDIRFRRTGIYAIGDSLTMENCRITLADTAWRTSSCGIWSGGIYNMCLRGCAFTGCGLSLAGPPLSEHSIGLPVLTGLFEVGEERGYFTSHTIENCTVNGKPLFYAVNQEAVSAPSDAGEIICCGCGEVKVQDADVSDSSMGAIFAYNDHVALENVRADRCGVFGLYVAKSGGGTLRGCSASETNHGLDIRASTQISLVDCAATSCDQGLFFSKVTDSAMLNCTVEDTGQGFFTAGGSGNVFQGCTAARCENGFNLQKEGHVLMTDCVITECTVCGVRLDATPTAFVGNHLRGNWVGVMAYGGVSFDLADNVFEDTGACALYLRNLAFSRICGNTFTGSRQASVQAVGTMGGSIWLNNIIDVPMDTHEAADDFILCE